MRYKFKGLGATSQVNSAKHPLVLELSSSSQTRGIFTEFVAFGDIPKRLCTRPCLSCMYPCTFDLVDIQLATSLGDNQGVETYP